MDSMTESRMMCENKAKDIADTIRECYEHPKYDDDSGEMHDIDAYLDDAYEYLNTLKAEVDVYSMDDPEKFSLMLGFGGPNIWLVLNGPRIDIEVYWGGTEHIMKLCSPMIPIKDCTRR